MSEDSTIKSEDFHITDEDDDEVLLNEVILIEKALRQVEDDFDDIEKTVLAVEKEIERNENEIREIQEEIDEIEETAKELTGFRDISVR